MRVAPSVALTTFQGMPFQLSPQTLCQMTYEVIYQGPSYIQDLPGLGTQQVLRKHR